MPSATSMSDPRDTVIAAKSGAALVVRAGETLRVTDLEGRQVADFVCFNQHDHAERFSAAKTRLNLFKTRISTGDQLYSNRSGVMFTIGVDTVGVHDLLFASCNRWLYANLFDRPGNTGCLEILRDALAPHGIAEDALPDPFNLFMKTSVDAANNLAIELPESNAGDYVELTAEMDCLVAATSCPDECSDCNGGRTTPVGLKIVSPGLA